MPIQAACKECRKTITVADKFAGKRGTCKSCGATIRIPDSSRSAEGNTAPAKPLVPARQSVVHPERSPQHVPKKRKDEDRTGRPSRTRRAAPVRKGIGRTQSPKSGNPYVRPALIGAGVGFLLLIILHLLHPALSNAFVAMQRERNISNLKQLGLAFQLFRDEKKRMPDQISELREYMQDMSVFWNPLAGPPPSEGTFQTNYEYVGGLDTDAPPHTIILIDRPGNDPKGGAAVYMDSHVKHFTAPADRYRKFAQAILEGGPPADIAAVAPDCANGRQSE